MKILCVAPQYDSKGKHDATGAFQPEAAAFAKLHGGAPPVWIDNRLPKPQMRAAFLRAVEAARPDLLAVFCHGWPTGIQFGLGIRDADALAAAMGGDRVVIYGCLTAKGTGAGGDGGFADAVRDALCRAGRTQAQVDAHETAGHATRNPFVRRFAGMGSATGGAGGYYLVAPKGPAWARWVAALKGDLRLRFPLMDAAAIHAELGA